MGGKGEGGKELREMREEGGKGTNLDAQTVAFKVPSVPVVLLDGQRGREEGDGEGVHVVVGILGVSGAPELDECVAVSACG